MTKTANYTDAQIAIMTERYTAETTEEGRKRVVLELADEFGKSDRSIRSKLVSLKVYQKKATISKVTGGEAMKKDAMAQKLADVTGLNLNVESVAKMNKTDIQKLIDFAAKSSEDETESENS